MAALIQDLRYGLRMLRRSPGFTAVAIITLALGIGANTAIFSMIDAIMLRPLPVNQPGELVELWSVNPHAAISRGLFSLPTFQELSARQKVFSSLAAWGGPILSIEVNARTVPGAVEAVTPGYFPMLGASPLIGRFLGPEDSTRTESPAAPAVISYRFWQEHFGGDRGVLGKTIFVQGNSYAIVGVARKDFFGVFVGISADVWVPTGPPLDAPTIFQDRKAQAYWLTARLRNGATIQQAEAQLEAIWPSVLKATVPEGVTMREESDFMAQRLRVSPAGTGILATSLIQFRQPLWVLMDAVGLVLLLACVNLANLMLARAAAREHEVGVRLALGATRQRLALQTLTESMMLSAAGAAVAFPIAYWTSRLLAHVAWTGIVPLALDQSPDLRVFGFAVVAVLMTGLLVGSAPALLAARQDPAQLLQHGPRTLTAGRARRRFISALVVAQVALSLALVDGAALFIGSLVRLDSVKPGFRTRGIIMTQLQPKPGGLKGLDVASYWHEMVRGGFQHCPESARSAWPPGSSRCFHRLRGRSRFPGNQAARFRPVRFPPTC